VTDLPASEARVPDVARRDELTVAVMEASADVITALSHLAEMIDQRLQFRPSRS
jgi:hypothetical protein